MKTLLLYSEDGCPWCTKMKGLLDENNIKFLVRDIDRYDKEWEKVSEEAKTEYIPTACIVDHECIRCWWLVSLQCTQPQKYWSHKMYLSSMSNR